MIKQNVKTNRTSFDEFKFNKYMSKYPFNDTDAFNQWLDLNDLTYDKFLKWFDKDNTNKSLEDCPWMDYLLNTYEAAINVTDKYKNKFGVFIDFIIEKSIYEFKSKLKKVDNQLKYNLSPILFQKLFEVELIQSLMPMIVPTLTLELNVARVSKKLCGKSPEQRFNSFIESLFKVHTIKSLFLEYPVLLNKIIINTTNFIEQSVELYTRLIKDFNELEKTFGKLGKFERFSNGVGDKHNNGRFVRVCQFENMKIVYKPRSLNADIIFQNLLLDINKHSDSSFKTIKLIDKSQYGWSEFVQFKETNTLNELKNYYINLGQYLNLLYVLNSSDFHYENIIANGECPILIDLESILHVDFDSGESEKCDAKKVGDKIYSVMDSYILPQKLIMPGQGSIVDISVLGYKADQKVLSTRGKTSNNNCDNMKIVHHLTNFSKTIKNSKNNQVFISDAEIADLVSSGFTQQYNVLLKNPNWLSKNKFYKSLCKEEFRCILKPTQFYANLISDSFHPDFLRSDTDAILNHTVVLWSNIKSKNCMKVLSRYEIKSMFDGNVPIFYFSPKDIYIKDGDGKKVNGFFNNTTYETLNYIQSKLSNKDLKSQQWLIKSCLLTKGLSNNTKFYKLNKHSLINTNNYCEIIANNLFDITFSNKKEMRWFSLHQINQEQFTMSKNQEFELYDGSLGTLLYLCYYSEIKNDKKLLTQVNHSISKICKKLLRKPVLKLGGFTGIGGILYSLSKIFRITHNPLIPDLLRTLVISINENIENDKCFDIIAGCSGTLLALIEAYNCFGEDVYIINAKICANHLIENFQQNSSECGWSNGMFGNKILGGFSHGGSGIGYALAKLSQLVPNTNYTLLAEKVYAYEDSLYDDKSNNYLDLRDDCSDGAHSDMNAWCHGSLGIGIARLNLINENLLPNSHNKFKREISRTVSKVVNYSFGGNQSLCHGDASNLEYLFQVSNKYPSIFSKEKFNKILSKTIDNISVNGQKNGSPFNIFMPSLMTGSIGLAYQLLRFKHSKLVGNVLLLN